MQHLPPDASPQTLWTSGYDGVDAAYWLELQCADPYTPACLPLASPEILEVIPPPTPESLADEAEANATVRVSVSTTFYPGAPMFSASSDLLLISEDNVYFYVHTDRISAASTNKFGNILWDRGSQSPVVGSENYHTVFTLPENSAALNVILHTMYGLSVHTYSPSFDALSEAIAAFRKYGISAADQLATTSPLYPLVIGFAPLYPAEVYTIAAEHGAHDLALNCSPHLISFDLSTLSDDMAVRIGPTYLKRLFFLHLGRSEALKALILATPEPHPETETCTFGDQRHVRRAWGMATASLAWDARPDISAARLEATLSPLANLVPCPVCKQGLLERVKNLVTQWSLVKRTIV